MKNIFIKIVLCAGITMAFMQMAMAENATVAPVRPQYTFTLVIALSSGGGSTMAITTIPNIPTADNCDVDAKLAIRRPWTYDAYCLPVLKDNTNGVQK